MMRVSEAWIAPTMVAGAVAIAVATMGATITDLGPWYRSLAKPAWTPPDAAFGAIWTAIFACTALAAVGAWRAAPDNRAGDWLVGLFALNGFLNIMWSLLFFRMQRPDWALAEVALLWGSIVVLIAVCGRHSRFAGMMLLPYLLWVSIAAALNYAIVDLNAPFG